VWDKALQARLDRNTTFLALGGGVIGDMAGFAAAAYQRGVHFIQARARQGSCNCMHGMHALGPCLPLLAAVKHKPGVPVQDAPWKDFETFLWGRRCPPQ
jgi:hypothetical protein